MRARESRGEQTSGKPSMAGVRRERRERRREQRRAGERWNLDVGITGEGEDRTAHHQVRARVHHLQSHPPRHLRCCRSCTPITYESLPPN